MQSFLNFVASTNYAYFPKIKPLFEQLNVASGFPDARFFRGLDCCATAKFMTGV